MPVTKKPGVSVAERVAELHARITEGVEAIVTSDDWIAMLKMAAKFHKYSFNNLMLIAAQRPEATQVAGFRAWQALGRNVMKGEKGIGIFAPHSGPCKMCDGAKLIEGNPCPRCGGKGRWTGFGVVYVFDVAQTEGDPLPEGILPIDVEGNLFTPLDTFDRLKALVEAEGFSVSTADIVAGVSGAARGTTEMDKRRVTIARTFQGNEVPAPQQAKTLAHELAHVLLHQGYTEADRARCEVEAESTAFIVMNVLGIETDAYSFPYVASWASGDKAEEMLRQTAVTVMKTAKSVLARLGEAENEEES